MMHLATDYVHPARGGGLCRLRIFVPDAEGEERGDAPVVVCTELPANRGPSVTELAESLYAEVLRLYGEALPREPVWIEHWPPASTDGAAETFELVVFAHPEVREVAGDEGEGPVLEVGRPEWKPLDRVSVEALVGRRV
jgi:hypothetical protein